MKITPQTVIEDLDNYLNIFDLRLSAEARKIMYNTEVAACKHNNSPSETLYLSEIIKGSSIVRDILEKHGCNPDLASYTYRKHFMECLDTVAQYDNSSTLYSKSEGRELQANTSILDRAIEICIKNKRLEITAIDLFRAVLDFCIDLNPPYDNGGWSDKKLHVPYNTLSHIIGEYNKNLFIKIDDIMEDLINVKESMSVQVEEVA